MKLIKSGRKPHVFTRIKGKLYLRLNREGVVVFAQCRSIEKWNSIIGTEGYRLTKEYGLEEIPDIMDPNNPTQAEQDHELIPFGGKIPWNNTEW